MFIWSSLDVEFSLLKGFFYIIKIFNYAEMLNEFVQWAPIYSSHWFYNAIFAVSFFIHLSMWEAFWLWNTFFKIKELFRFSVSSCINFCHLCVSRCLFLLVSCQVYWHRCFLIYSNYLFNVCTCTLCHSVISNSLPVQGVISNSCQAPLCMGFFRQEYWSGLPLPSPGDLFDPGIEPTLPVSPVLAGRFFTTEPSFNS